MLKVKTSVELVSAHSYVGYNCESIEFRDENGNSVSVKMNPEQMHSLTKQLGDRYKNWLKDQAEKIEKTKAE